MILHVQKLVGRIIVSVAILVAMIIVFPEIAHYCMAMKPHLPCPDTPQRRKNRKSIEDYLKYKYPDSTFPRWKAVNSGREDGDESKPVAAKCEGAQANDLTSSFVDKRSHCSSRVESGQRNSGKPTHQTSTKVSQPEADARLRGNQVRREKVVTTESHYEPGTHVPKKIRERPKKDVTESKIVSVPSPPVLPIPKSVEATDNEQNPPVVELPHRSPVKNSQGSSKNPEPSHVTNVTQSEIGLAPKRKRGRPKKGITHVTNVTQSKIGLVPKRKRGRPKKAITKPTIVCVSSSSVPPIPKSVQATDNKQNTPVVELRHWSPMKSSQGDSNSEPSRLTSVTGEEICVGLENSRRRRKEDTEPQNVCDSSSPIISHIGHHPSGCEIPVATIYPMITQLPGSEKTVNYKLPEVRLNRLKYELYDHIEKHGFISFSRVMLEMGLTSYMAQSKTRTIHSEGQTLPSACKDPLAVTSSKSLVDISSNYSLPDGTPYDHLCETPGNRKLCIKGFSGFSSPEKDAPMEYIMKPRSRTSPKQYGKHNIEDTIISRSKKSSRTNKSGCEPAKNLLSNGAKRLDFGLHDFRLNEQCVRSKTVGKNRSKSQPAVVRQSPKKRWKSNMPIRPKSMCTKHGKLWKPKKIVKKSETKLPVEEPGDEDNGYSVPVVVQPVIMQPVVLQPIVVQQVIMQRLVMHNVPYEQPSQSHQLVPADMIPTVSKNVWKSAGHDDTISIASSAEYLDSSDSENERMVQSLIEKEKDYLELQDICYISEGTQHHAPSNVELEDYCYVSEEAKRDVPSNEVDSTKQLDNLLEQQRSTSPAAALVNTSIVQGTAPNCNQGPSNLEESVSTKETPLSFYHDESNSSTRKEQIGPRTLNDFVKGNELEVDPANRVGSFTPNKMQSISPTELVENVETVDMPPSQMISKEDDDSKSEQPGVLSTPEKSVSKLTLCEKNLAPCLELRSNFNGVTELKKDFTPQEDLSSSHVNSFESVIHEGISRSSLSGTTSNKGMKGENIQNSANEVTAYKPSLIDNGCKKTTDNQGDGLTTDKYMSVSTVRSVQTILPLESPEEERSRQVTPEVFVQKPLLLEDFRDYICGSLSNQNDLINQEDGLNSIQNHHITPASSIEDIDSLERSYRNSLIEKSLNGTYKDIQIHSFEPEVFVEQSPYNEEDKEPNSKLTSDYSDPNNLDEALNVPTIGETMHDDPSQSGCPPLSVEKLSHVDKSVESTSTLSEDDIVLTNFKNYCIQDESCSVTSADLIGNMEVLGEVQKELLLTSASVLSDKQLTVGDKSRETCSTLSLDNNDVRYQGDSSTSDTNQLISQVDSVENMEAPEGSKTYRELCEILMSLEEQSHNGESGSSCSNSALILNDVSVPNTALSPVAGQKILLAKPGKNLNGLFTLESIEGMELLQGEETNQPHVSKLSAKEAMLTEGSTESCCKLPFIHSYAIDHEYSCNSVVYQSTSSVQSSGSLKTVQPSVSVKNVGALGDVEKNRLLQPCGFESSVEESSLVEECSECCTDLPSVPSDIATNENVFNAVMNQSISSVKCSKDLNTISPTESVENVEPLEGADEDQLLLSCASEFIEESSLVEECTESCSELPLIPNVVNILNAVGNQSISPAESCRIPNTISSLEAVHEVGKDQILSCKSELSVEQPLLDEQGTILCSGLPLKHYDDNIADQFNESTPVVNQMVSSTEPSEYLVTLKETNDYVYKKITESERSSEVQSRKGISSEFSENSYESFSELCSDHHYSKRQDGGSNSSENRSMLPSESVEGMERLGKAGGGSLGDISPVRSSNVLSNDDTNEEEITQSTLEVFTYKHSNEKSRDLPVDQIESLAHVEPQSASPVVSCENDNAVDGIVNQITVNGSNIKKTKYSISLEPSRSSTPEVLRADLSSQTSTNRDDLPKKGRTLSPQQSKLSSFDGKSSLSEICGVSFMQAFDGVKSTNLGELFTSESTFPLVDKSLIRSNGDDEDFYEKCSQGNESADFLEMSYFTEALGDVCLRDNLPESSEDCLPSMHVVESADFPSASPTNDFVEESAKDGGQLAESGAVADLPDEFANECLDLQQLPTLSSSTDLSDQNVSNPPNICSSPELIFDGLFYIDDPIDLPCGGDLNKLSQYEPKSDVLQSSSLHGPPYEKDSVVNPDDHHKSLNITDQETETNNDLTSKPPSSATQPGDNSLSFELSRPLPCQIADGNASNVNNLTGNKCELGGEISFSLPNREVSLTVVPQAPETVNLSDETASKRKQSESAEIGISRKVNDLLFDEEFEPCNNVTPVKRTRVEKRMSPCTAIPEGSILFDEEFESSNNLTPAKKFIASSRDQVTVSRVFTRTSSDLLFDEEFEQSNNVTPFKEQMSGINRLQTPSPQTVRLTALGPVNELVIDDNDDPPLNGTSESDIGKRLTSRNTAEGCVVISSDEESETPLTNNYPSLNQTNSARPINRPVMQLSNKTSTVLQNRPVGGMNKRDPIATSCPIKVGRSKGRNPSQERMAAFSPILEDVCHVELSDTESETEFTDSPLGKNSVYTPRCNGSPPRKIRILSVNSEETSGLQTPEQVPSHLNALNCNGEVYISGEVERSSQETSERQSDGWSHCAPIEPDEVSPIHLDDTNSESNSTDCVSRKPHPCPTEESTTSHCVPEISSASPWSPVTAPVEPSKVTENSEDIIELSDSDTENAPTSLALSTSDRMQCIVRKLPTDYLDEFIESDDSSVVEKNEQNASPPKTLSIQRQDLIKNYSEQLIEQVETLFQKKGTSKSDKSSTESHPTHKEASVGSDGENSDTMSAGDFIESDDCVCTGQEKASRSSPDHSASRHTLNHSQKSTPRTVQTLRPPSMKRIVIRQNRTPLIIAPSPSLCKKRPSATICIGVPVEGKNSDGSGSNVSSDTSRFTSAEALPSKLSETLNQKKITSHSKTSYTESHRTFKEALIISDGENSDTMPVGDFVESDDDICSEQEEASYTYPNHSVPKQTLSPPQKSKTRTLQTPIVTKEVMGPSGSTLALDTSDHIECSEIVDSSSRLMSPKLPSSKPPSPSITKRIVIRQNSKPSRTSLPSLSKKRRSVAICVEVPVEDKSYGPGSDTSSDEVLPSKPLFSTCLRTPLKEPSTGNVKLQSTANKPKPSAKGTFSSSVPRSKGNDNYSFKGRRDGRDISSKTPSSGTGNAIAKSHFNSTPRYLLSPQRCDLETRIQEKIESILQIKKKPANNELRSPVTSRHVSTYPTCDIEQVHQNGLLDNIGDRLEDDDDSSCSTTADVLSSKLALSKKSVNFIESVSRKNTQLRKRTSAASRAKKTSSARGRASRGKGFSQPRPSKKAVS